MSEIKIGDFVKGTSDEYWITNTRMTRGVVIDKVDGQIRVKVIDHEDSKSGCFWVDLQYFEVIGHQKPFNRDEVLDLLLNGCKKAILEYDLSRADLSRADLSGADLSRANLSRANLSGANLDFSCLPLWCGGLNLKVDKRLACQLTYHLCSMQCDDAEFVAMRNSILRFANQFHRADTCGILTEEV